MCLLHVDTTGAGDVFPEPTLAYFSPVLYNLRSEGPKFAEKNLWQRKSRNRLNF